MPRSKSMEAPKKLLVIHGPNLNLLGERKPEIYGALSLREINKKIKAYAAQLLCQIKIVQSNHEGELIDFIHTHRKWAEGIVINPGAFTHYSYAIRDALEAVMIPAVEVHLSDIMEREEFRRISVISPVCQRQISGLGVDSYLKGIQFLMNKL